MHKTHRDLIRQEYYKNIGCRKPRSKIHFRPIDGIKRGEIACGKQYLGSIGVSSNPDKVTCCCCIERMKESMWHCSNCGFIDDENVTFQDLCDNCGELLV